MRLREISIQVGLILGLWCLMMNIGIGQGTWTCDADSPYPYPEEDRYQVLAGEDICIPIIIDDFTNVNTFTLFISFDSRFLRFTGANTTTSGLPNFPNSDVRYFPDVGPDILRVIWQSANTLPFSLPSGTVLFEACFKAIGPPGSVSPYLITKLNNQIGSLPEFSIQDSDLTIPAVGKNPCTFQDNTLIRILPQTSIEPQLFLNSSCGSLGINDSGVAEFSIFNGERPYEVWNTAGENFPLSSDDSTFVLSNLPRGDYSYFIIDNAGLSSDTVDFTIGDQIPLTFLANVRVPSCADGNNGFINMTVGGGITYPNNFYRYEWSNGVQGIGENEIVNIDTGFYSVAVFDSTGCRRDTSFLFEREVPEVQVDQVINAFCAGRNNGRLFVSASGGLPHNGGGYDFELDGISSDGTIVSMSDESDDSEALFSNLGPGRYVISALDSFAARDLCPPIMSDTIEIFYSKIYSVEIFNADASGCAAGFSRAQINMVADNPGNSFDYDIFNSNGDLVDMGQGAPVSFMSACLPPGDYSIMVTDRQAGCGLDTTFSLFACDLDLGFVVIGEPCFNQSNGLIAFEPTSSNGPITISWSTGDTVSQLFDIGAGVYDVTVTDTAGCLIEENYLLSSGLPWQIDIDIDNPICVGGVGALNAIGIDGEEPYIYAWSTDSIESNMGMITDLNAGLYYVTVEDDEGCQLVDSARIVEPEPPLFDITNLAAPFCEGDNSGRVTLAVTPNPTYSGQFAFETSSVATGGGTLSFSIRDFESGENWVLVTHAITGCVFDTIDVIIPEPEPLRIDRDLSTITPPECFGGLAFASLTATGATGIEYIWSDGLNTNTRALDSAGTYIVMLSAGNCMGFDTLVIGEPDSLILSIDQQNSSFAGCDDFTTDIVLQRTGGNSGVMQWIWVDAAGALITQDSFFNNVPDGDYTVTATDSQGCVGMLNFSVETGSGVQFEIGEISQPLCFGELGTIRIDTAFGGAGNYRYQVNTSPAVDIAEPFEVPSGDYLVSVFDLEGCSADTMITINVPPEIIADLGPDIEIGLGESDTLSVEVSGNVGIGSVFWDPSDNVFCLDSTCTSVQISPVLDQTYTVTVIDENGCEAMDDINVTVVRVETVYIPNAFAPTQVADARNRTFRVFPGASVQSVDFIRVFDRWGNLVHFEEAPVITVAGTGSWDGSHGGQELNPGVFVYVVQVTLLGAEEPTIRRGNVTLIR